MIGKIKRGKNFAGVCRYVLQENKQVPGRIIGGNMEGRTSSELAREFEVLAAFNDRVKVPVKHFSLSFAETDEKVSDDVKVLLALDYMEKMGYGDSQYVIVSHDRTDHEHAHDHIHIVANSVAMDGRWVNDRLDWKRSQNVLRDLEGAYDLTPVLSSWDKKRDLNQATRCDRRAERLLANGIQPSQIERTHADIQTKIELAATGATSTTQFCARLQTLEIEPIPKITRTGKVQGISYRSGDVVVRGSDLDRASFPALQQRGVRFDPARDLVSLRSVLKGAKLKADLDWVIPSPATAELENLPVTGEIRFTPPEISENPLVTTQTATTPTKSPAQQEIDDETMTLVAHAYPELKSTPEYQQAAARQLARQQALYEKFIKSRPPVIPQVMPDPPIVKWQPPMVQTTQPETIDAIERSIEERGSSFEVGHYQLEVVSPDRIEVKHRDKLVMFVNPIAEQWESHIVEPTNASPTINQHEAALTRSLLAELDRAQEHELAINEVSIQEFAEEIEEEREQEAVMVQEIEIEFRPEIEIVFNEEPRQHYTRDRERKIDRGYER
jgi:Relaxase/Mobilisation nuclease domain